LSYALVARLTSRFLLLLTATPVENDVEELYNLVSLLRPGHLGARAEFVRRLGGRRGRPSESARREVRALLGEIMVRNTRALSGVRLPPRFARTVLVAPTPAEDELYGHLVAALRTVGASGRTRLLLSTLLQEAGSSPLAVAGTLRKLADGEGGAAAREALAPAVRRIEDLPESGKGEALLRVLAAADGPAVVFTRYRATLSFIEATLARRGLACERVDGAMPVAARHEAIARCRERGSVLVSTDVGSEGLNLQFCHRLVNFDLPWNPMRIEQRIGRLHRIGQEHAVDVVNFCLAGSIEERILRILDERINLFELVVGEAEMILGYLDEEREFPDLVLEAFAEDDGAARESRFDRIADALAAARVRYQNVKAFDEALFRNELGV
jgi:SNF2 family DNA or RNA helicase